MIVFWRNFSVKRVFRKMEWHWETQKQKLRKVNWQRTSGTTKWHKLAQVGVRGTSGTRRSGSSDLRGTSGKRERGSSDRRGTSGTRTSGLSSWISPLVPKWVYKAVHICPISGRTRKYFFQLVTVFVTSFPKNGTFWPRRYKTFWTGRNVTIRLGLRPIRHWDLWNSNRRKIQCIFLWTLHIIEVFANEFSVSRIYSMFGDVSEPTNFRFFCIVRFKNNHTCDPMFWIMYA